MAASPFRLQVFVLSASPLYKDGLYSFSIDSAPPSSGGAAAQCYDPTRQAQTKYTANIKGCTVWNEKLSVALNQKSSVGLDWTLKHKPTADAAETVICRGDLHMVQPALDTAERMVVTAGIKFGVFDAISVDLHLLVSRNDKAISLIQCHGDEEDSAKYGVIYTALHRLIEMEHFALLPVGQVKDCVKDANLLVETFVAGQQSDEMQALDRVYRTCLKLFNGNKYLLSSKKTLRAYPIEEHSLQLNLSYDDYSFVLLTLANRLAMWTWTKWVTLAFDCWTGRIDKAHPPQWATTEMFSSQATVLTSSGVRHTGRLSIRLDSPFELRIDGTTSLSLQGLCSFISSADAVESSPYLFELEVAYCSDGSEREGEIEDDSDRPRALSVSQKERSASVGADQRRFPALSRWKLLSLLAEGASTAASSVGTTVTKAAQKARKSLTKDEVAALEIANASKRNKSPGLLELLSSTIVGGTGAKALVVKAEGGTQILTETETGWRGRVVLENFFSAERDRTAVPSTPVSGAEHEATLQYANGSLRAVKPGLLALLYGHGHRLLGEKHLNLMKLYDVAALHLDRSALPFSAMDFLRDDQQHRSCEIDVPLDQSVSLSIRILRTEHLRLPGNLKMEGRVELYCKCKLVDCDGHSGNKSTLLSATGFLPFARDAEWSGHSNAFSFHAKDGAFDSMEFVRVEVLVAWGPKVATHQSIGAAFVPLSLFTSNIKQHLLPVINFRRNEHLLHSVDGRDDESRVSTMLVEIQRLEAPRGRHEQQIVRLSVNSQFSPISNTMWTAECSALGYESLPSVSIEHVFVQFGFEEILVELHEPSISVHGVDVHKENWRSAMLTARPNAVLGTSLDYDPMTNLLHISYDKVLHVAPVTRAVLSVQIQVRRFLRSGSDSTSGSATSSEKAPTTAASTGLSGASSAKEKFQTATVEVFVTNCPAQLMCNYLADRKDFYSLRSKLRKVMQRGQLDDVHSANGEQSPAAIPETENLSEATVLFSEIDYHTLALETQLKATSLSAESRAEVKRMMGRVVRLRLYTASLFGVGLRGGHGFTVEEVRAVIDADVKRAQSIVLGNDVATAVNRVEFLLDVAEKRIRDAAICGWRYRDSGLQQCVETFVNGYFAEIVGLLGSFFEDKQQASIKGLTSKIALISAYMRHNDRLETIIESALRPYGFKTEPPATLSLFLDFDVLVGWYTSALTMEMRAKVDDVLRVWTDAGTDTSGQASLYKHKVPWVPQRERDVQGGPFLSRMPEDLRELLGTYLTHARMNQDEVAPSFRHFLGALDAKVSLSHSQAFAYFASHYRQSLSAVQCEHGLGDGSLCADDEALSEFCTWLAAVSNDALRVCAMDLAPSSLSSSADEERERVKRDFNAVAHCATHGLTSLIFQRALCGERDRHALLKGGPALLQAWLKGSLHSPIGLLSSVSRDVVAFADEIADFLSPKALRLLQAQLQAKALALGLSLLRALRSQRHIVRTDELLRTALFSDLLGSREAFAAGDRELLGDWQWIEVCAALVREDSMSSAFVTALKSLVSLAKGRPGASYAAHKFAKVCLSLRGVAQCMPRHTVFTAAAPAVGEKERERDSLGTNPIGSSSTTSTSSSSIGSAGTKSVIPSPLSVFSRYFGPSHLPPVPPPTTSATTANTTVVPQSPVEDYSSEEGEMRDRLGTEWALGCVEEMLRVSEGLKDLEESLVSESPAWTDSLCALSLVFARDKARAPPLSVVVADSLSFFCPRPRAAGDKPLSRLEEWTADLLVAAQSKLQIRRSPSPANAAGEGERASDAKPRLLVRSPVPATLPGAASPKTVRHALRVSDIKVLGSLDLLSLSAPRFFVQVQLGDDVVHTKAEERRSIDNSYVFADSLELHYRRDYSEMLQLRVSLVSRGVFVDERVATTVIEFMAFSPPACADKVFVFHDWSESFRVSQAVKHATEALVPLPQISLSLSTLAFDH